MLLAGWRDSLSRFGGLLVVWCDNLSRLRFVAGLANVASVSVFSVLRFCLHAGMAIALVLWRSANESESESRPMEALESLKAQLANLDANPLSDKRAHDARETQLLHAIIRLERSANHRPPSARPWRRNSLLDPTAE